MARVFDPYLIPGTNVLRNLVGATDEDALAAAENDLCSARAAILRENLPPAEGTLEQLRRIHRFLFQDVYDWAGEIRTIDMGKLLNMNPDFYRRRIRRIRPAAIAVGLSAICLIAIFLIPSESNPVFQNFFSALFGFFLGLASSAYEKFRKWAERVNQTMKDAEGSMPIWEAIYKNSIFYDECFITLPAARVSPTWAQRAWIKIRFPSLSRKWHKYFRNGMTEPGLQPLSNERKRRKRLHYLESLSRCVFMLEPYQATLDYLLDYSDKILGEKIRQDKILKGYLQPVGGIYIYQKNVGK
jgi:hypothetical protein